MLTCFKIIPPPLDVAPSCAHDDPDLPVRVNSVEDAGAAVVDDGDTDMEEVCIFYMPVCNHFIIIHKNVLLRFF
jgi:hypothetical protein